MYKTLRQKFFFVKTVDKKVTGIIMGSTYEKHLEKKLLFL